MKELNEEMKTMQKLFLDLQLFIAIKFYSSSNVGESS